MTPVCAWLPLSSVQESCWRIHPSCVYPSEACRREQQCAQQMVCGSLNFEQPISWLKLCSSVRWGHFRSGEHSSGVQCWTMGQLWKFYVAHKLRNLRCDGEHQQTAAKVSSGVSKAGLAGQGLQSVLYRVCTLSVLYCRECLAMYAWRRSSGAETSQKHHEVVCIQNCSPMNTLILHVADVYATWIP